MAKRSDFKRVERDYYRTFDPKAGLALRGFLPDGTRTIEPFAGAGDLINQTPWLDWIITTDIEPQAYDIGTRDAFSYEAVDLLEVDVVVTNPPWSRPILHKTIEHFAPKRPTWLLLDANWVWTKQASPFIEKYLTDIVSIGRLQWIEGTTMSGKDDVSWFRFSSDKNAPTRLYGRRL